MTAGARQHPPHDRHRQQPDHHRSAERGDDPDDQVLLGVDIPDDPGQEVAAPERRQAGGRQPLEALVDLHPEVSEQPEGGVVADQPLPVAEEAARQPEELHGDNGQGQSSLVGVLGRSGDEPRRGADESDIGGHRAGGQKGRQCHPTGGRSEQTEGPAQRGLSAVHARRAVAVGCHEASAVAPAGQR